MLGFKGKVERKDFLKSEVPYVNGALNQLGTEHESSG
jgi:hypothetical protein